MKNVFRSIYEHTFRLFDIENVSYDDHLLLFFFLLRECGIDFVSKKPHNRTDKAIFVASMSAIMYVFISELVFIANNDDMDKTTECLMTLFLGCLIFAKVITTVYYRVEINFLILDMGAIFDDTKNRGGEVWNIMLKRIKEARLISRLFFYSCIFVGIMYTLLTALKMDQLVMMIPAGMAGLPNDRVEGYAISTGFHCWCIVLITNILVGTGSIWIYLLLIVCAQSEILCLKLKSLENVDEQDRKSIAEGNNELENRGMDDGRTKQYLKDCFEIHQWLLRTNKLMNSVYRFDCISEIICTTIVGCFSMYQIAENPEAPAQMYAYFVSCTSQIFLYCWYGELVSGKLRNICDAIYLCPWYKLEIPQQRSLLLMLTMAQKPVQVDALFLGVDLITFTNVMKTAYSYYAVLSSSKS